MIQKYFIAIFIICMGYAQADEKKWFGELGWKVAPFSIGGAHISEDNNGLNGIKNEWKAMHMLYGEVGYIFPLENDSRLYASVGFESLTSSAPSKYSAIMTKSSLLFPIFIQDIMLNIGPKLKMIIPVSASYEDTADGEYTRKVKYDTNVAFAFGVEAVWGEDDLQFVTGIEYLASGQYSGSVIDANGKAESKIDLNGMYLNLGVRYRF